MKQRSSARSAGSFVASRASRARAHAERCLGEIQRDDALREGRCEQRAEAIGRERVVDEDEVPERAELGLVGSEQGERAFAERATTEVEVGNGAESAGVEEALEALVGDLDRVLLEEARRGERRRGRPPRGDASSTPEACSARAAPSRFASACPRPSAPPARRWPRARRRGSPRGGDRAAHHTLFQLAWVGFFFNSAWRSSIMGLFGCSIDTGGSDRGISGRQAIRVRGGTSTRSIAPDHRGGAMEQKRTRAHDARPTPQQDDPGEPHPWCVEFTAPSKTGGIEGAPSSTATGRTWASPNIRREARRRAAPLRLGAHRRTARPRRRADQGRQPRPRRPGQEAREEQAAEAPPSHAVAEQGGCSTMGVAHPRGGAAVMATLLLGGAIHLRHRRTRR